MASMTTSNQPRRTLLLTGASRGIGHATVKRFSAAGWRVITCSRHPFPENCPWEAGPEDHIQVDLADPENTAAAIAETKRRLNGELHALVNNAAISPKAAGGKRLGSLETSRDDWHHIFPGEFLRADHAGARPARRALARRKVPSSTSRRLPARACIRLPAPRTRRRRQHWLR